MAKAKSDENSAADGATSSKTATAKASSAKSGGAQSRRDSLGVSRATTGVDRHHVASSDGALAQTIRTIGGL